jgi:hypothetical protein
LACVGAATTPGHVAHQSAFAQMLQTIGIDGTMNAMLDYLDAEDTRGHFSLPSPV